MESRIANKAEITAYKLGGDSPWYICRVCARTQVYDPRKGNGNDNSRK